MKNWPKQLIVIALTAASSIGCVLVHAETIAVKRAAETLSEQFETIAYTRLDFLSSLNAHDPKEVDSAINLRLPFLELIGGLNALGPDTESNLDKSYGAVLVGAKEFAAPERLGAVSSRRCYIAILQGTTEPNMKSDFWQASTELIDGRQVWTWSIPPYEGHSQRTQFYAAQIGGLYLVVTNNREDFKEAAKTLTSVGSPKPVTASAFDWQRFSTFQYWAYRFLRRGSGSDSDATGIKSLESDVTTLMFFANLDKSEGTIQVVSSDRSMKTVPKVLPPAEMNRLQPLEPGVWQAILPVSKDQQADDSLFQIMYVFGFGVAL